MGYVLLQSLIPGELSLLTCIWVENATCKDIFELTQLALCEKIVHWGHQLKAFRGNLTSLLPEEMDNNWGKQ